jgi:hypothetical protein
MNWEQTMTASPIEYSETNDLYMEILKKAQMQADQELVNLIRHRIKNIVSPPKQTLSGCEIIPYPFAVGEPVAVLQDICFWKKSGFWQDLVQFLGVLSFSLSFVLSFFVLSARI